VKAKYFKCSLDYAKLFLSRSTFYFGQLGRIVSKESVIHHIKGKCLLVLLDSLRPVPWNKQISDHRIL